MLTRHHLGAKPRFEHFVQNTFLEGVLINRSIRPIGHDERVVNLS